MGALEVRSRGMRIALWILAIALVVIFAFPFVYLLMTSFKTQSDAIAVPPSVLPDRWTTGSYVAAISKIGVVPSFLNSLMTALLTTAISLALGIPAAYSITKFSSRIGQLFLMGSLVVRMIPPVAIGVPLLTTLRALHLYDTPTGLALAHCVLALPLSIWLLCSFFEGIPDELEEAARVDGCTRFQALRRVVLPTMGGGVAVTALFAFLASWNDFLFALLLTATKSQTTPIMIQSLQTQHGLDWATMAALAVAYSAPVVVVTFFLQKQIVAGMTLGAVKG